MRFFPFMNGYGLDEFDMDAMSANKDCVILLFLVSSVQKVSSNVILHEMLGARM